MTDWPTWWAWELELSPHVRKRMMDRRFAEVDLRSMMHLTTELHEDDEPGRWVAVTTHDSKAWNVIVEPDARDRLLVVINAFPVDPT